MTTTARDDVRRHPVACVVSRLHEVVDEAAESSVWSMSPGELRETLLDLHRLKARVAELELRVAAHADVVEVGDVSGATSTAAWWAHATRQSRPAAHRRMTLARALDGFHEPVRDALAAGDLAVDQAQVVVDAVQALPEDLVEPEIIREAQRRLIVLAGDHDARALRVLGRRILDVIAPEVGEAHEARQHEREEHAASEAARFTISDDGHGRAHGRFTLPTLQAEMLRTALHALAAPRHLAVTTGAGVGIAGGPRPTAARMGKALMEYVEGYPTDKLPHAGGVAATVVVTMRLDTLLGGLRAAHLDTGAVISPGQARRLACSAGTIPVVLGGASQVLDLGRRRRFHNTAQRIALGIRDRGCTAEGCDSPPSRCHAHHDVPWSQGGPTTLDQGRLLCPRHHTRAHDPTYDTRPAPGGKITFHRRT